MPRELADELENVIEGAAGILRHLPADEVGNRPSPEQWSKQELLGHLIDSAANNHHRFVRAQQTMELTFPPYDQNAWVACQRYSQSDWNRLVDLWVAYNRHLVHVIANIPPKKLATPCWVEEDGARNAVPLRAVVEDYIAHARHHLEQILGN